MKRDPRACPYCKSPSRKNPCFWAVDRSPTVIASVADGRVLSSVEWDNLGPNGSYRVRIGKDDWIVVPDEALLTVPNKAGEAWVWTYPGEPKRIRCFLPGAFT